MKIINPIHGPCKNCIKATMVYMDLCGDCHAEIAKALKEYGV